MKNCGSRHGESAPVSDEIPTWHSKGDHYPAILGLQGFFPLKGQAAVGIGSIEYPAQERKRLAALYVSTTPHLFLAIQFPLFTGQETGFAPIVVSPTWNFFPIQPSLLRPFPRLLPRLLFLLPSRSRHPQNTPLLPHPLHHIQLQPKLKRTLSARLHPKKPRPLYLILLLSGRRLTVNGEPQPPALNDPQCSSILLSASFSVWYSC